MLKQCLSSRIGHHWHTCTVSALQDSGSTTLKSSRCWCFERQGQVIRATFPSTWGNLSRHIVALQLAKLCCPRITNMLQKSSIFTSCNMLLQLATLIFVTREVACEDGNTGNKALQLAKQRCCRVRDRLQGYVARITWPLAASLFHGGHATCAKFVFLWYFKNTSPRIFQLLHVMFVMF